MLKTITFIMLSVFGLSTLSGCVYHEHDHGYGYHYRDARPAAYRYHDDHYDHDRWDHHRDWDRDRGW